MIDPNQEYDLRRCRTCGVPLEQHTSLCSRHAFIEMPHIARQRERQREYDARHGVKAPASPVDKSVAAEAGAAQLRNGTASNLPAVPDDATKAPREVAGVAPTRGWRDGRAGSGAIDGGLKNG
jgi:hypothetical protein